jgi:hypothetical protein
MCVAYEDLGSITILNNFDCSDGSSDPPATCATGVDDSFIECFDFKYDGVSSTYFVAYKDALTGLHFTQSADGVIWSPGVDVDGAANDGHGISLAAYEGKVGVAYWGEETGQAPVNFVNFDPADPLATLNLTVLGTSYTSFGHNDQLTVLYDAATMQGWGPIIFAPNQQATGLVLYTQSP